MISGLLSIWILSGIISILKSYIGVTETALIKANQTINQPPPLHQ